MHMDRPLGELSVELGGRQGDSIESEQGAQQGGMVALPCGSPEAIMRGLSGQGRFVRGEHARSMEGRQGEVAAAGDEPDHEQATAAVLLRTSPFSPRAAQCWRPRSVWAGAGHDWAGDSTCGDSVSVVRPCSKHRIVRPSSYCVSNRTVRASSDRVQCVRRSAVRWFNQQPPWPLWRHLSPPQSKDGPESSAMKSCSCMSVWVV